MSELGSRLYRIAATWMSEITVTRVLDSWLADFRFEYGAATRWSERARIRLIYTCAWFRYLVLQEGIMSAVRTVFVVTVLFAAASVTASHYLWPKRFKSEAFILVVPQQVSPNSVGTTAANGIGNRLNVVTEQALSQTRLETIINDLHLYEAERAHATREEIVRRMRGNIGINILGSPDEQGAGGGAFRLAFTSSDARAAQQVAARLANLFTETNQHGEPFQVVDLQLPTRPTGPNRIAFAGIGGVSGFLLALTFVGLRRRRTTDAS